MAVQVKLFSTLVNASKTKQPQFEIDWRDGLTPQAIIDGEGFNERDQEALAVAVNGAQAEKDHVLADGDVVDVLVNLAGG